MELQLDSFKQNCSCGRQHLITIEKIIIDSNSLSEVSAFINEKGLASYPMIICDTNTYQTGGSKLQELLKITDQQMIVLNARGLHADEFGLKAIKEQFNQQKLDD